MLIGGGTTTSRRPSARRITIVDLQALDLGRIEERPGGVLAIGATTTLQSLAGHPAVPPAVRETAHREAPSTLRNLASVAGCVATSDPDSEVYAHCEELVLDDPGRPVNDKIGPYWIYRADDAPKPRASSSKPWNRPGTAVGWL